MQCKIEKKRSVSNYYFFTYIYQSFSFTIYFVFAVNDTGLGSEHFGSSSPTSSSAQPRDQNGQGVFTHVNIANPSNHHIVTHQVQDIHQQGGVSHQATHIDDGLQHLGGEIVASVVPAVSVVVNDEDGLLPLEPLSNSDYSYALDEQEDLNELFDSFPF